MSQYIGGIPLGTPILDKSGNIALAWQAWFSTAQQLLADLGNSGTTAQRPTSQLYTGKFYFDTTLGLPVWIKGVNPTVWVNGAGTPV